MTGAAVFAVAVVLAYFVVVRRLRRDSLRPVCNEGDKGKRVDYDALYNRI